MDRNLKKDAGSKDSDDDTREGQNQPGLPRPGKQVDQSQQEFAPPQPGSRGPSSSTQMIPPMTGNPDLDPAGLTAQSHRIDLRQRNPLSPDGMLYDPRRLLDSQRHGHGQPQGPEFNVPPGARFDPFGPPDPDQVGPGRGPHPSSQFGVPDPDHFAPPGVNPHKMPQPGKGLKQPWPPGGPGSNWPKGPGGPFL